MRDTYSRIASTLALVVALGAGGAYAATQLPAKSVGTKQLQNKAVTIKKIAPAARDSLAGQDGAPGAPGTTGQSMATALGTGQVQVNGATPPTLVPGLTQTFTVPAGATVYVATDGGIQNTGTGSSYGTVDLSIVVDGSLSPVAQRRVVAANTDGVAQMIANWSLATSLTLTPGSHTVEVRVAGVDPLAATANVSSSTAPQLQGRLTVLVQKS